MIPSSSLPPLFHNLFSLSWCYIFLFCTFAFLPLFHPTYNATCLLFPFSTLSHIFLPCISTHASHSFILSTALFFPLLLLRLFFPPFRDSVAADVGMWACLTESCMRGLSNFYSDSKKRIRTSYQSKSGLPTVKAGGIQCVCTIGMGGSLQEVFCKFCSDVDLQQSDKPKRWLEVFFFLEKYHLHFAPQRSPIPVMSAVSLFCHLLSRAAFLQLEDKLKVFWWFPALPVWILHLHEVKRAESASWAENRRESRPNRWLCHVEIKNYDLSRINQVCGSERVSLLR